MPSGLGAVPGHLFFVGRKETDPVPSLAICHDKESAKFTLCYCDTDWSPIGIGASYESIEAAKRKAERIYPGSSSCWVEAHFSEQDGTRYLDEFGIK